MLRLVWISLYLKHFWTNILGPIAWIVNWARTGDNMIPGYNIAIGVISALQKKVGNLEKSVSEIEERISSLNLTLKDTENIIIETTANFENIKNDLILVLEKSSKTEKLIKALANETGFAGHAVVFNC